LRRSGCESNDKLARPPRNRSAPCLLRLHVHAHVHGHVECNVKNDMLNDMLNDMVNPMSRSTLDMRQRRQVIHDAPQAARHVHDRHVHDHAHESMHQCTQSPRTQIPSVICRLSCLHVRVLREHDCDCWGILPCSCATVHNCRASAVCPQASAVAPHST
jgi:hypothetical protein